MKTALFVGGPLDGRRLSPAEVGDGFTVMTAPSGGQFVLAPVSGDEAHPYRRVATPSGVEYHDAADDGSFAAACAPAPADPGLDALLDLRAREFAATLGNADLGNGAEVFVVFHVVDRFGYAQPPVRESVMSSATVRPQSGVVTEGHRRMAEALLRQAVLGNVANALRGVPRGWFGTRENPAVPVRVVDAGLAIEGPPCPDG